MYLIRIILILVDTNLFHNHNFIIEKIVIKFIKYAMSEVIWLQKCIVYGVLMSQKENIRIYSSSDSENIKYQVEQVYAKNAV